MVAGKFRSRKQRRIHKVTPGGKTKLYHERKSHAVVKCAECKTELKGIPRMDTNTARNTPKSKKTVERAYGGFLCPSCLKAKLKKEARSQ